MAPSAGLRGGCVGALCLLGALPAIALASRLEAAVVQDRTWGPEHDEPSSRRLAVEEEEARAGTLKCEGVRPVGASIEKREIHVEGKAPVVTKEEVAELVKQVRSAGAFPVARATGDGSSKYTCERGEWERFKKMFGLSGPGPFSDQDINHKGVCKEKNVVWLYPKHDESGAFSIDGNVCYRLLAWSYLACSVHLRHVGSMDEAMGYLARFPADSITHLVLGGHGTGYAMDWGGSAHGWFGVEGRGDEAPVGSIVQAVGQDIRSLNAALHYVHGGDEGYVGRIDADGDAFVHFAVGGPAFMPRQYFNRSLKRIDSTPPTEFMAEISARIQPQGSIFTDSCWSATSKYGLSLAAWVAKRAGKGVRVIGSTADGGNVSLKGFTGQWRSSLQTPIMLAAQRDLLNSRAECPDYALYNKPDSQGNCRCRQFKRCRTSSGKKCPAVGVGESNTYFMPFCGAEWAEDRCACGSGTCRSPSLLLLLSCCAAALWWRG